MHFTSISTIPLALALLLSSSSLLSVSAAPDSVAIVKPSENNQDQFDYEALTGPTLPHFTTRRNKARGRALTDAKNIAITNTAVGGRDVAHPDPSVPDNENPMPGGNEQDAEAFDAYAKSMCPFEPTLCGLH